MITIPTSVLAVASILLLSGLIFSIGFVLGALALYVHHRKQRALAVWVEENVFKNNARYFANMYTDYERSLLQTQIKFANGLGVSPDPYFETRLAGDSEEDGDDDFEDVDELLKEERLLDNDKAADREKMERLLNETSANTAESDAILDMQDYDINNNGKNKKSRLH